MPRSNVTEIAATFRTRTQTYVLLLVAAWTVLVSVLFAWMTQRAFVETRVLAETEARAVFSRDKSFRLWLASHGGVYVPAEGEMVPNPWLAHLPERDIVSHSGRRFTLITPAEAIRRMNDFSSAYGGVTGTLTSLDPLYRDKLPDDWERAALVSFETGNEEAIEITELHGAPYLRLMQPLIMTKSCLGCHGHEGYREGDVRGGVGISMSLDELFACRNQRIAGLGVAFGLVWFVGTGALWLGSRRIRLLFDRELQTQEALRESEAKFRTLFEASADAEMVLGGSRFRDCNEATLRVFGCSSKSEFCGKGPADLSPTKQPDGIDSRVAALEHIDTAMREGSCQFEWAHQRVDGKTFQADVLLSRFRAAGETLLHATVRDITEVKEAVERLRLAAEVASDLIYEWDLSTDTLQWFGDAGKDLGIDPEEIPCTFAESVARVHPDDRSRIEATRQRYATSVEPVFDEYRTLQVDGTLRYWSDRAKPVLDELGRPVKWIGVCTDVTEKKQADMQLAMYAQALEQQRAAMEELYVEAESSTRAKSEFLANMSHEIRTPMTAILGYTDVLLDGLDQENSRTAAQTIKRNGEHLLAVINDILDLSKIEAGKLELERKPCSAVKIISDVVSLMKVRADAKRLPLDVEYVGAIPETFLCDETRLRQILINLIGNAIKFTDKGKVRLVVRLAQDVDSPTAMRFDVIDTGIGLSEEQASRIFQPFTQAYSSTNRKFGGTGLGLAISQRLANRLGGKITLASQIGKGSTFSVTIATGSLDGIRLLENPAKAMISRTQGPVPADASHLPKLDCRILLAEDSPDSQRLFSFLLRNAGADVVVVDNGRLALENATDAAERGSPFDVILMDVNMPEMDGYEATRRLRATGYDRTIIALTAHAMKQDQQQCLAIGCDDVATKPIDRDSLLSLVARHTVGTASGSQPS